MPRKLRVSLAGVPEHVIQRGNNRQIIFANEEDMQAYVTPYVRLCLLITSPVVALA